MFGYAGRRRRAARRIGTRDRLDRRMGASGHRRGRNLDGLMWVPGRNRGDRTPARGRGRVDLTTVEDLDRSRVGLTMARGRGLNQVGRITVLARDPNRVGRITVLARDPNRVDRVTAHRPNPGNRMADRDRNRHGLTPARDRSRTDRVVEAPQVGRRVSVPVAPIRGLRVPTNPTNVSPRHSNPPAL